MSTLIDKLGHETKKKAEFYTLKNGHESIENFLYEMELYATHKIYNNNIITAAPQLSNWHGLMFYH